MKSSTRQLLLCVLLWTGLVVLAAALWRRPLALTAVYSVASVALLAIWRSKRDWVMFACGFVLGPGGEIFAVYHGAWSYAEAPWLIPTWLPPAWGLAAVILLRLATRDDDSASASG